MEILDFLRMLRENNNRDWFNENKHLYLNAREQFEQLVEQLISGIEMFDPSIRGLSSKDAIFRIYRDVRFSKNKLPYKTHFGAYLAPGGRKSKLAGYYIHIEPDNCIAGGGLHSPGSDILKEVRFEIYNHWEEFGGILADASFKKILGELRGEKLKRPTVGFPKDFAHIEWIKYKEFLTLHKFPDSKFSHKNFIPSVLEVFKTMKPLKEFLNRPLEGY